MEDWGRKIIRFETSLDYRYIWLQSSLSNTMILSPPPLKHTHTPKNNLTTNQTNKQKLLEAQVI